MANTVTPDCFRTTRTAFRRGRDFDDADRAERPRIAIIHDTVANRVWPGGDPLGRRFRFITAPGLLQVVGVVATTKDDTLGAAPTPAVFVPLAREYSDAMALVVRAAGDPAPALGLALRAAGA